MDMLLDNRIKILADGELYCVGSKLICCQPGLIDLSDSDGVEGLVDFANDLFRKGAPVPALFGKDTVCMVFRPRNTDYVSAMPCHVDDLKPDLRDLAREELSKDV